MAISCLRRISPEPGGGRLDQNQLSRRIVQRVRLFDSSQGAGRPVWQYEPNLRETSMTASTMLVIIIGVLIFAAFAGSLAWAQLYVRPASTAPVKVVRPKRRTF
jgi:hypothetical protein